MPHHSLLAWGAGDALGVDHRRHRLVRGREHQTQGRGQTAPPGRGGGLELDGRVEGQVLERQPGQPVAVGYVVNYTGSGTVSLPLLSSTDRLDPGHR